MLASSPFFLQTVIFVSINCFVLFCLCKKTPFLIGGNTRIEDAFVSTYLMSLDVLCVPMSVCSSYFCSYAFPSRAAD